MSRRCAKCNRKSKRKHCYKCEHEARKLKNPYLYWYGVLRRNAKRRNKKFALTYGYWVWWCDRWGYLTLKGIYKNSMSIDRKKNHLGYVDHNLAPLTVGENSSKGTKKIVLNYVTRKWDVIDKNPIPKAVDEPF